MKNIKFRFVARGVIASKQRGYIDKSELDGGNEKE